MTDLLIALAAFLGAGLVFYGIVAVGLRVAVRVENMSARGIISSICVALAGAVGSDHEAERDLPLSAAGIQKD